MQLSNIIGFLKWHVNTYKFDVYHLYIFFVLYLVGNMIFVDPSSYWFSTNIIIGLIVVVVNAVGLLIVYPIKHSYKRYQESKSNLLKTIDNGN